MCVPYRSWLIIDLVGMYHRLLSSNSSQTGSLPHWRRTPMCMVIGELTSLGHQRYSLCWSSWLTLRSGHMQHLAIVYQTAAYCRTYFCPTVAVQSCAIRCTWYSLWKSAGKCGEGLRLPTSHKVHCQVQERAEEDGKIHWGDTATAHQWYRPTNGLPVHSLWANPR